MISLCQARREFDRFIQICQCLLVVALEKIETPPVAVRNSRVGQELDGFVEICNSFFSLT